MAVATRRRVEDDTTDARETETESAAPRRPSEPLETGDRYRIGSTIGRGGMGEVVGAHDADIGREVAIKRLRAPNPTPIALSRFLREARIQGRLDHPAIVPVYELGYDDAGRPFFAMKKLSGTTLAASIADPDRRFTRRELLRAFADVCLAVEFAHTRGVIHRDIKPANILLGEFGEVYVLDWGIARMTGDREESGEIGVPGEVADGATGLATRAGVTIGTCGYMAPEQVRGERGLDKRTDVYALGCVLFEILAGTPLHPSGEAGLRSTIAGIDARPSIRSGEHDLAPELDELCVRATWIHRDGRIGSARELAGEVQRYLDGDQNLTLRGGLARERLAAAHAALARGDGESDRRIAMREAGQALALDPTLIGAAELVGRLMIEPPSATPSQVVAELDANDREIARKFARQTISINVGYLVIGIVLWAFGLHDLFYVGSFILLAVSGILIRVLDLRSPTTRYAIPIVIHCGLTIVLVARMFSPILIAPALCVVNLMAAAFHPVAARARVYGLAALCSLLSVLGMWAIEALGWVSPTMSIRGGTVVLRSPVDGVDSLPSGWALVLTVIALIGSAAMLAFAVAREARAARHRLHVQAWQLRQLLSAPATRE